MTLDSFFQDNLVPTNDLKWQLSLSTGSDQQPSVHAHHRERQVRGEVLQQLRPGEEPRGVDPMEPDPEQPEVDRIRCRHDRVGPHGRSEICFFRSHDWDDPSVQQHPVPRRGLFGVHL